ncbi:MAG: anion permease [Synergistaceae bacterium]|nr:anion permease [Synergistaceae bacterium]
MDKKKLLYELASIVLGLIVAFLPPPAGLTVQSMWTLGIMLWAIMNWMFRPVPEYVAAILMCSMWVVLKIVPFADAFGALGSSTVWLVIGVLGIGTAVTNSGLLKRITLMIMKLFPSNFKGQVMAILGAGTLTAPLIPSTTAKVSIAGPIVAGIGVTLGLGKRSTGMSGLMVAMYTGFCLTGPVFLSASFFAYVVLGVLPAEVQAHFTWMNWFLAALPWSIVMLAGSYFAIILLFSPKDAKTIPKEVIREQIKALGPLSKNEKITLIVLAGCIVLWILEARMGIPAVIPSVVGLCLLTAFGVLSIADFNTKIPWNIIAFVAGILGLAKVLSAVGVNAWIGATCGPYMSTLSANPYLFVAVTAVAIFIARFIVVDQVTPLTLFTVILAPFCVIGGMNPWIGGFIVYIMNMMWVVQFQNPQYVIAMTAAGGEENIHYRETTKFCFAYLLITVMGLLICVPYWKMIGLIQ